MDNVNALVQQYDHIDTIAGAGFGTFCTELAAAIVGDMVIVKTEVLGEASLQGSPGAPPQSAKFADIFGHKSWKPKEFSGEKGSEVSYSQWRLEVHKFVKYTDASVSVMLRALDTCESPLSLAKLKVAMEDTDDQIPKDDPDIVKYGGFVQDLLTSLTGREARVTVDT